MIKPEVRNALNDQTRKEFYSHYLYLSMAAYFESINLRGFAHWMRIQAKEEEEHAMKFFEHTIERQGRVVLEAIDAPLQSGRPLRISFRMLTITKEKSPNPYTRSLNLLIQRKIMRPPFSSNGS